MRNICGTGAAAAGGDGGSGGGECGVVRGVLSVRDCPCVEGVGKRSVA